MGRPRNPDRPCRVTINIPKSLLDQLEKEVPSSEKQSLSGLIVSKIAYASTSRPVGERNLTIIAELKPGTGFADVLKQLQMMDGALQVTHISGNLDFTSGCSGTVETVILPRAEAVAQRTVDVNATLLTNLDLPERAQTCMRNADIKTVGELRMKTAYELTHIRNFGLHSLKKCQEKLRELGIEVNWID